MSAQQRPARDWHAWYRDYDDPASSLSRRLAEVRTQLARTLAGRSGARLLSLCAGDGRDALPMLAEHSPSSRAVLVELDPALARAARATASELGLDVDVRTGDAGDTAIFADLGPADVLMLCGVFGNIPDDDVARTVAAVPGLLRPDGVVVWTRGRCVDHDPTRLEGDPSEAVRRWFAEAGLTEVDFVRPQDAGYRVGVHRWTGPTAQAPSGRLFGFV